MDAFDSTFLTLLFVPNAKCSVDRGRERVDFLISDIHGKGNPIVIPAPVLAEVLVGVGHSRGQIVNELTKNPKFVIAPFDVMAAIELAVITESFIKGSQKKLGKRGGSSATWAKVTLDRQIVAIAKVAGASTMYTEDKDMRKVAEAIGMKVRSVSDLPLPYQVKTGETLFDRLDQDESKSEVPNEKEGERKT